MKKQEKKRIIFISSGKVAGNFRQKQDGGHIKQSLSYSRKKQSVARVSNRLKRDCHHIAKPERCVQYRLRTKKPCTESYYSRILIEKSDHLSRQNRLYKRNHNRQQNRAFQRKPNCFMESIIVFCSKGICRHRLIALLNPIIT